MPTADVEEVLFGSVPVVFALDQRPFEVSKFGGAVNKFGVLVPLMTDDGRRFDDLERTFENRGRVWWMLLPEHEHGPNEPGALWTGRLENALRFDPKIPEKDRYQVQRHSVLPGAKDWVDVLDVPFDPTDVGAALAAEGIPLDRPPLRTVVLRGQESFVGPLLATWNPATGRALLAALNPGAPRVFVAPSTLWKAGEHFEEFRYRANRWFHDEPEKDVSIRLLARKHLDLIEREGRAIDAGSDAQVVKWALGLANYTGAERSAFRDALSRLPAGDSSVEWPGRIARFRSLCERADRVRGLGIEVAEALGRQPAFAALLRTHADALVEARVADVVDRRTVEVEKASREATARCETVKGELAQLEKEYDSRKSEQEARLAAERAEWLRAVETREAEVAKREAGVDRRQKEMEDRLSEVLRRYEERGREIGTEILAQVPILRRLGFAGGGGASTDVSASLDAPQKLALPGWLSDDRPRGGLSESAFLAQFRDVAKRRGYVFDEEDLTNFHVSVKVGFWTVLAGPSGTGKTSLPRIYAEALGAADEYLSVPVRPDWLDDRDVIGAFNALAGRFEPAPTGLVDRLIAAAEDLARNRGGVYVVCLDEMNLARVEHYFAQFLSVIEEPPGRRRIQLFSRGIERAGEPYGPWRELPVGDNVRFVGTVNIDETTHFFSPKVLDRAPVLTFEPPSIDREPAPRARAQALATTPVHFEEYAAWVRGPEHADPQVRALIVELDKRLRGIRSGLGFRLRDRVLSYTASAAGLLPPDRALDFALAQSVVPRIRSNQPAFREAIDAVIDLVPEKRFPRSGRLLGALRDGGGAHDFFQLV